MLPNAYHVIDKFGIDWVEIPNDIKKERKNFSIKTTKISPSQFGVFSAIVVVLLILHLSALEP
jgi:hypothetical protein